jgi:hypothetical protein
MADLVTIRIVPRKGGGCDIDPLPPIHAALGVPVKFVNNTANPVTIEFEPPLPPASIPLALGGEFTATSPTPGDHAIVIACYAGNAGPKLIIDNPA